VVIDGQDYATSIQGTFADLVYLKPVRMTLCAPDVHLAAGQHTVVVDDADSSKVDHIDLFSGLPAPADPGRAVAIQSWSSQRRVVQVSPGPSSFLQVNEAYNSGWSAALGKRTLTPIRLDGWAQGFVIPPGEGGKVTLTFGPDRTYRLGLVAGLAAVVIVLLAALGATRGLGRRSPEAKPATRGRGWLAAGAATAAVYLVAGPMAAAIPPLVALRSWRPRMVPWIAVAAMASAGALAAVEHGHLGDTGAFSVFAQASAVLALASVLAPAVEWPSSRWPRRAGGRRDLEQQAGAATGR
jgi:arabinofuranan 3-O-arabinosyltransferase